MRLKQCTPGNLVHCLPSRECARISLKGDPALPLPRVHRDPCGEHPCQRAAALLYVSGRLARRRIAAAASISRDSAASRKPCAPTRTLRLDYRRFAIGRGSVMRGFFHADRRRHCTRPPRMDLVDLERRHHGGRYDHLSRCARTLPAWTRCLLDRLPPIRTSCTCTAAALT